MVFKATRNFANTFSLSPSLSERVALNSTVIYISFQIRVFNSVPHYLQGIQCDYNCAVMDVAALHNSDASMFLQLCKYVKNYFCTTSDIGWSLLTTLAGDPTAVE